jgi:gamma-glutamyltranspeptidase/glutathione hydrolase
VANVGYSHRAVALGHGGLVASAHPLATLAGIEILKSGATAADAAVAVNALLGVTQPYCCGVGGDIFVLYYEAATRRVHFLNGAGRSGSRATPAEMTRRGWRDLPVIGPGTVSVPGCVRGWGMLLERFGTRPLASLLAPAIQYAHDGFATTSLVSQSIADFIPVNRDAEWHRVFAPGGRAHAEGERLRQVDLARTLTDLGHEGPDLFYGGRVGRAIAARMAADGFLTEADLAEHIGEWDAPISTAYRGVTVYQTPPPTQGLAALLALNILEGFDVGELPLHGPEHLHLLLETVKLAYADRDRFIGDPEHTGMPLASLLAKEYAARRRQLIDSEKAQPFSFGDPEGDTTGFVIADAAGNVVSVIESLFNPWGSGVVVPGTGVLLHNRGRHFRLDPQHPSVLAPRKRPFHTLVASIATRDDRPVFALATMGGNGQAMFHTQIVSNLLDYGMDVQEAIERPRFLIGPFLPDEPTDQIHLESRIGADVVEALGQRGHRIRASLPLFQKMGHAHGVVLREDGLLMGGADPRGDGVALGF